MYIRAMSADSPRILLIKTHAIGDVLMATPAFRSLREGHPRAHIALLVGKWSYPAVRHNPCIDEFIVIDENIFFQKRIGRLFSLVRDLRKGHFDMAVVLHPSRMLHLLAWLAGIPQRFGLEREKKSPFLTSGHRENGAHSYYYPGNFVDLARLAGGSPTGTGLDAPYGPEDHRALTSIALKNGFDGERPYVLVAPGGARNPKETIAARLWPIEKYAELLTAIKAQWPSLPIVLSGGPGDAHLCDTLVQSVPGLINLCAQTDMGTLVALVGKAAAVVCNDSSVLHLAVAHQRPVYALFGPTSAESRIPDRPWAHGLSEPVACSPCYRYAVFPGCAHEQQCMRKLSTGRVLQAMWPTLENAARTTL